MSDTMQAKMVSDLQLMVLWQRGKPTAPAVNIDARLQLLQRLGRGDRPVASVMPQQRS